MRTSLDIARLSRENSSATFETGPLQGLRRRLRSLSTLGSADALGDFGTNTAAAAAAAAAAMEAALDGGGGGRESSTRVERLLQERQRSMLRIKSTAALRDEDGEARSALSEEQSGEPPRAGSG